MISRRSWLATRLLATVLATAGWITCAHAQQWHELYEDGLAALKDERFDEAVTFFTRAIEQRPESRANARTYGVRFTDYFPYVYRGVAYQRLGKTALALRDFEREHDVGEAYKGSRDTDAGTILRERLEQLRTGATIPRPLSGEAPSAQQRTGSGRAGTAFTQHVDSLFTLATGEAQRGNILRATTLLKEVRSMNASLPGLAEQLRGVRTVELEIKEGIKKFLGGRYRDAVAVFTPILPKAQDHPVAHGFLASSHAALYLLSGEEDEGERAKAEDLFAAARRIDPRFALDTLVVSPAIRKMLAGGSSPR